MSAVAGRTLVWGILNVTPDSFSDGGDFATTDEALAHGRRLAADGADVVDVGGESTRPGADRVDEREELRRVLPVVAALADDGVVVSVDTTRAGVAAECLRAGATWINDVSGGLADERMLGVVAGAGAGLVTMHWRGHSRDMAARAVYDDVVAEVATELADCRDRALAAGVDPDRLVLDPGIGFAKTAEHNWAILRSWEAFERLGHPLLLAVSRKRFLGSLLGTPDDPRPPRGRDVATAALTTLFAARGVWGVRVHDVRGSRDAVDVAQAMREDAR